MNVKSETTLTYTHVPASQISQILEQIRVDQFRIRVCKPMVECSLDPCFIIVAEKTKEDKNI